MSLILLCVLFVGNVENIASLAFSREDSSLEKVIQVPNDTATELAIARSQVGDRRYSNWLNGRGRGYKYYNSQPRGPLRRLFSRR